MATHSLLHLRGTWVATKERSLARTDNPKPTEGPMPKGQMNSQGSGQWEKGHYVPRQCHCVTSWGVPGAESYTGQQQLPVITPGSRTGAVLQRTEAGRLSVVKTLLLCTIFKTTAYVNLSLKLVCFWVKGPNLLWKSKHGTDMLWPSLSPSQKSLTWPSLQLPACIQGLELFSYVQCSQLTGHACTFLPLSPFFTDGFSWSRPPGFSSRKHF